MVTYSENTVAEAVPIIPLNTRQRSEHKEDLKVYMYTAWKENDKVCWEDSATQCYKDVGSCRMVK